LILVLLLLLIVLFNSLVEHVERDLSMTTKVCGEYILYIAQFHSNYEIMWIGY